MAFLDRTERLRQLIPRYWRPFASLVVGCLALVNGLQRVFPAWNLPLATGSYWLIGLGLALFITVRFPRVFTWVTRGLLLLFGAPKPPANPPSLFHGPRPYRHGEMLPGRQRDIDACWRRLQDSTFLILEGESGCGKSSLLNAAILPRAQERFRVVECRIADDPCGKLHAALLGEPYGLSGNGVTAQRLAQTLTQVARSQSSDEPEAPAASLPVLVCIDQCEELFVTVRDEQREQFFTVLTEAVQHGQMRLLVAIRNDFRDLLYDLCRTVDAQHRVLDPSSYYSLPAFRKEQAEAVLDDILRPVGGDDPLLRQQLEDFAHTLVADLLRPPRDQRLCQEDQPTVLPVELQTVGMMIERVGVEHFSVAGFRRLGGKTGLLRAYVEQAKEDAWRRTGIPGDRTLLILRQLISPAGTKWAQTAAAISTTVRLPAEQVEQVLEAFAAQYLVNRLPAEGPDAQAPDGTLGPRYELMHEHLVHILAEAPDPILQKAREAEERLRFWVARSQTPPGAESSDTSRRLTSRAARRVRSWFAKPMPVLESLRLWRFTRSDAERRLLRRNLRGFGLRTAVVMLVLLPVALVAYEHLIAAERRRIVQNMGALQIRNVVGAALHLQRIKHYTQPKAYPAEDIPVHGTTVYLPGPADYVLEARKAQAARAWPVRYPVYIRGYKHQITVTVQAPPKTEEIPPDMAYIPGGVFRMGDTDGSGSANERPAHDVTVDGFFLDQYEVTNAQYQQCVDAGACSNLHYDDGSCYRYTKEGSWQPGKVDQEFQAPQKPVVCVDWQQATTYCEHVEKRLPTEAEWEKAAEGPEGYKWAFGNGFDGSKANYCDQNCPEETLRSDPQGNDGYPFTAPVGSYPPNGYGLYDMSGNVWEWVADYYDGQFYSTPEASQKNPVNQTPGDERLRVVRGGGWNIDAEFLRAGFRIGIWPDDRRDSLGFRCVLRPPE